MEFYALKCNQFLNFIAMNQLFAGCLSHFLYIGLHCVYGLLGHFENTHTDCSKEFITRKSMSNKILYFSLVVALYFSNGVYGKAKITDTETIVGTTNVTHSLDNAIVSKALKNLSYAEDDNVKEPNVSTMALPPPGGGGGDTPNEGGPSNEFIFNRIPTKFSIDASTTELLGERIDFNNGNVSFNHTDVVAAGNGPTITVSRTLRGYAFSPHRQAFFGDWSLDIPAIHTTLVRSSTRYSGAWGLGRACSGPIAPGPIYNRGISYYEHEYWNGDKLVLPGGNSEELLENTRGYLVDDNTYTRVTKSNWKFSCIDVAGVGEGFKGVSPKGITYTFSKYRLIPGRLLGNIRRYNAFMLVTKIEDRFGNYVNYNYTEDKLSSISASDGRRVSFTYGNGDEAGFVKSVSYNNRTWSYSYSGLSLKKVTQPDGKSWKYDIANYVNKVMRSWDNKKCNWAQSFDPDFLGTITHPNGVTGTFTFSGQLHGRSNVKMMKIRENETDYFTCHDYLNYALKSKTLSGPGINEKTWNYSYSGNWGTWSTETPECPLPH
tara:strand:+ start:794 stop:2431 length:1638 start_codon:yes stop_codon:yes gene_type:complete